jgi:hypothetical protein
VSRIHQVYLEESEQGFTGLSALRLTTAALMDAVDDRISRDAVEAVKETVVHLDEAMAAHPDGSDEGIGRERALTGPLLSVLDRLLEGDVETALAPVRDATHPFQQRFARSDLAPCTRCVPCRECRCRVSIRGPPVPKSVGGTG